MVVMTVLRQDQDGSGEFLCSLLPSIIWQLRKKLIKFVGMLLLGREREKVGIHSNCFKCLQSVQTVSASLALLLSPHKEQK
jgi:hypothetical protein